MLLKTRGQVHRAPSNSRRCDQSLPTQSHRARQTPPAGRATLVSVKPTIVQPVFAANRGARTPACRVATPGDARPLPNRRGAQQICAIIAQKCTKLRCAPTQNKQLIETWLLSENRGPPTLGCRAETFLGAAERSSPAIGNKALVRNWVRSFKNTHALTIPRRSPIFHHPCTIPSQSLRRHPTKTPCPARRPPVRDGNGQRSLVFSPVSKGRSQRPRRINELRLFPEESDIFRHFFDFLVVPTTCQTTARRLFSRAQRAQSAQCAVRRKSWRTHSCVPRRHSWRRLCAPRRFPLARVSHKIAAARKEFTR